MGFGAGTRLTSVDRSAAGVGSPFEAGTGVGLMLGSGLG